MTVRLTSTALVAVVTAFVAVGSLPAAAQQDGPPARGSSEVGNFGDVPFSNPQIVITRAEDRATWRQLEDKHLREIREFEDKVDMEIRALRRRQAEEREAALKRFTQ